MYLSSIDSIYIPLTTSRTIQSSSFRFIPPLDFLTTSNMTETNQIERVAIVGVSQPPSSHPVSSQPSTGQRSSRHILRPRPAQDRQTHRHSHNPRREQRYPTCWRQSSPSHLLRRRPVPYLRSQRSAIPHHHPLRRCPSRPAQQDRPGRR